MDKKLTNQELFDNACLGIIGQGYRAAKYGPRCVVLSKDGKRRCAIGWSVTDAKPCDDTTTQWDQLAGSDLGERLREAHDESLFHHGRKAWEKKMAYIAIKLGLDDSCLWMTKV